MLCDLELRTLVSRNLASLDVRYAGLLPSNEDPSKEGVLGRQEGQTKAAAVALIIVELGFGANLSGLPNYTNWQREPAIILTRRSLTLRSHPGQWALPGGRIDPGETTEQAARREAKEEIDMDLTAQCLIGKLDDFTTRSGFIMRPLVFWGGKADNLQANPDEVAAIHRIPISELMRADAPMLDHDEIANDPSSSPVLRMPIGDSWIAAPTAAILYQFREVCILGRQTRVAHFDQPRFAWR